MQRQLYVDVSQWQHSAKRHPLFKKHTGQRCRRETMLQKQSKHEKSPRKIRDSNGPGQRIWLEGVALNYKEVVERNDVSKESVSVDCDTITGENIKGIRTRTVATLECIDEADDRFMKVWQGGIFRAGHTTNSFHTKVPSFMINSLGLGQKGTDQTIMGGHMI